MDDFGGKTPPIFGLTPGIVKPKNFPPNFFPQVVAAAATLLYHQVLRCRWVLAMRFGAFGKRHPPLKLTDSSPMENPPFFMVNTIKMGGFSMVNLLVYRSVSKIPTHHVERVRFGANTQRFRETHILVVGIPEIFF